MMAFQRIGETGSTNLASVGARDRRSARRHRSRPRRCRARGGWLQLPVEPRQAVRLGDGRLRDGVPEHRGEELHLTCRRSTQAVKAPGVRGRGRRVGTSARRDQRRAAGRRDAGAADHLHGDGADDSARHRRAGCRSSRRASAVEGERLFVTVPATFTVDGMRVPGRRAPARRGAAGAGATEDGVGDRQTGVPARRRRPCSIQDLMTIIDRLKDAGVDKRRHRCQGAGGPLTWK